MRKKQKIRKAEAVEVFDTSTEGKGIGKVAEMIVFIDGAVPGDVCDINIHKVKKNFGEAKVDVLLKPSPLRVKAVCKHFGVCGGCKWQNLSYASQLEFKQKQVTDALKRIGKVDVPVVEEILGSANHYFYRNKLDFSFSSKRWLTKEEIESEEHFSSRNALGFHIPNAFDKVLDIEECMLQAEPSNSIRNWIKAYAINNNLDFFAIRDQVGFLRNLIIRTTSTGEVMVIIAFYSDEKDVIEKMLSELSNAFSEITSLLYVINNKGNDTISDLDVLTFKGNPYIEEQMEALKFRIGPKSFYQTNSLQAYELYKVARNYAELTGNELVYDLYTGTGTIANYLAGSASKVIGIEYVEEAVRDARINSELNNIENTLFYSGDMKDVR